MRKKKFKMTISEIIISLREMVAMETLMPDSVLVKKSFLKNIADTLEEITGYIDEQSIKKEVKKLEEPKSEYVMRYDNEAVQLIPDKVQPLVRCFDCGHFDHYNADCMEGHNPNPPYEKWFCADGVKKED